MNRAVHGDVVAVEVFPESEWKAPADEVVDQESKGCFLHVDHTTNRALSATLKNDDADESEDEQDDLEAAVERKVLQSEQPKRAAHPERQPTGRVVGIIKRNWRS